MGSDTLFQKDVEDLVSKIARAKSHLNFGLRIEDVRDLVEVLQSVHTGQDYSTHPFAKKARIFETIFRSTLEKHPVAVTFAFERKNVDRFVRAVEKTLGIKLADKIKKSDTFYDSIIEHYRSVAYPTNERAMEVAVSLAIMEIMRDTAERKFD